MKALKIFFRVFLFIAICAASWGAYQFQQQIMEVRKMAKNSEETARSVKAATDDWCNASDERLKDWHESIGVTDREIQELTIKQDEDIKAVKGEIQKMKELLKRLETEASAEESTDGL